MLRASLATTLLLALVVTPSLAAAKKKPVIAVLYFDNDTGDKEYNVLQKGFADMLITDLSGTELVTVVERDKLQAVLSELKLQRGRYFNKKTAIKLGRGLGAKYALTGSFVAVKPLIRINARLIEMRTGKVVFGLSVKGRSNQIFDLEQKLVRGFLAGLQLRFDPVSRPKTKAPNLKTVMAYSKAMNLADEGDYEKASSQMKSVVSSAPTFALARVRRAELIKRYEASKKRRVVGDEQAEAELLAKADAFLRSKSLISLEQDDAQFYIGHRVIRSRMLLWKLNQALTAKGRPRVFKKSRKARAKALGLARAYVDNELLLLKEIKAFQTKFATKHGSKVHIPSVYAKLPDDADRLRRRIKMDNVSSQNTQTVVSRLFRFTNLGWFTLHRDHKHVTYAPPLALLDRKRGKRMLKLLGETYRRAHAATKKPGGYSYGAASLLEYWANYYFLLGQRDKGVAKLQEAVDRYPEHARNLERKIESELGIKPDHSARQRARFAKGLKTCDFMDINVGIQSVGYDRVAVRGFVGNIEIANEVIKACGNSKYGDRLKALVYRKIALSAAAYNFCSEFDKYIKLAVAHGMSSRDAAGYRKNWSKCP